MDFPKDFEIQGPCVPVTMKQPILTKRSPVSSSIWLGSGDVLAGRSGGPGNSWDPASWSQAATAALVSASQHAQTCSGNNREMQMPAFNDSMQMSYSSLLALSGPPIMTDMTNLAPLLRAQIASSSSGSQMMPATSPSQNHFLLNSAQIAASHSASQMMPATSTYQNHFLLNSAQFATTRSSQTTPAAPSNENHLLLNGNGNSVPTSSASNSNNWPLRPLVRQSQHVLPTLVPNINSVPEIDITNTFVSKPVVSPVTPAKLVQNMKMQDCRVVEIIDLGDDTPASQNIQMNEFGTFQQPREEEPQLTFSIPGVPSRIVSMQQQKGEVNALSSTEISLQKAEGENQGIDLNKTPQQKPKRKKHRPKVIREGKPAKRPKSVTPKPVTPRRARKTENLPEGKRKYVRKKKDMVSKENPSDELGDTINPQSGSKSVRRSLNFASEDCQARDVMPGLEMMSTHNADYHAAIASSSPKSDMKSAQGRNSRVLENPQAAIASYSAKSDMQSVQEWESRMLENSQAAIASSAAQYDMHSEVRRSTALEKPLSDRISFDLNSSVNQFDAECLTMLQTPNLPPQHSRQGVLRENQLQDEYISMVNRVFPPQPGRREGENLKKLARKNNYFNVAGKCDISLEDGQNQVASENISEALLKGTKRDHTLADDAQVSGSINLMHAYNRINNGSESCDTSRDAMCSLEIYKKKKTENIQNEGPTAYSTFACTSGGWKIVPPAQNTSNALTFADAQRVMTHEKWRALEHMFLFNQAKRTANNKPVQDQCRPSVGAGFASQTASTPLKPPCHSSEGSQPSTPEKPSERTANNRSRHHRNPPSVNAGVGNQRASTPLKLPSNSAGCQTSTHEKPSGFTCNPDQTPPSHNAGVCNQRTSTPVYLLGHNSAGCQPSTPEKPSEFTYNQGTMGIGPQARIEAAIASNQLKLKARRSRKKEQVPLNPMSFNAKQLGMENEGASSTTDASHRQESLSRNTSAQSTSRKNSRLCRNSVLDFQHTSSYEGSVSRGYQLGTVMLYQDPVDEIVQKLRHLNICEGYKNVTAQEQNALVPYVGGGVGTMVVYDGTKKRRPRPKVDLDPESDRVWKLLMGKECDEGDNEMGADKEKWWEEERRVFRGRADSFIARMHLVQGDRRFSKWKGSVVDSVIGVFLTQNVSDHLSSSAYMSLAAKFPARSSGNNHTTNVDKIDSSPMPLGDTISGQGKMPEKHSCDLSSVVIHDTEQVDEKKMENCHESPESNTGSSTLDYLDGNNLNCHDRELGIGHESPYCGSVTAVTVTSSTSGVEGEDRSLMEDVVSSQNSVVSSQNSSEYLVEAADPGELYSLLNFDSDDLLSEGMGNSFSSFTELLKMASSSGLHEMNDPSNGRTSCLEHSAGINQLKNIGMDQMPSLPNPSDDPSAGSSIYKTNSHFQLIQSDFVSLSCAPSLSCNYQNSVTSKFVGLQNAEVLEEGKHDNVYPNASTINKTNRIEIMHKKCCPLAENSTKDMEQQALLVSRVASVDTYAPVSKSCMQPITSIGSEVHIELNASSQNNLLKESTQASPNGTISSGLSLSGENVASLQQREREATFQVDRRKHEVKDPSQIRNFVTPQTCSTVHNSNNQENTLEGVAVKPNLANEASFSRAEASKNSSKAKNVKSEIDKTKSFDWDSLRKQACLNGVKKERNSEAMDSLDYEALRNADVNVISYTIRERGMNNLLAERIKEFLNRLVRDHGSTDLEWLRDVPPDKAKDYLLSVRGLGLKSVECVRLLTLHHLAFPVDTNVGRIAVRLGWVPLQPLPESLQLHLLEMYPLMETIQKYLWPRLCKLDQRTLYELHYQLITFGKVFCTKSKPNCNACPMRGECKHFASAFASARLALPGPEEKRLVSSTIPNFPEVNHVPIFKSVPHPQLEGCKHTQDHTVHRNCEPIIEEPASPEPECMETLESAIEDAFFDDPDEIPTIKLDMEEFTHNLQSYIEQNNLELQDGDMSKALIAITPDIASIPMPKLKNVSRLRTEHQVYELPDSHPLLEGMDRRERDDPSPYLLAIWTPGETAQSTEPPKVCCNSHDTGNLCKVNTCFSCNSIREAKAEVVRGTVLIPCRTAMRGSFPLNGTYFQVNEVFADHDSSRRPIDVPRNWLWNLPRRTVYFGTSVPTIFKGLTTEGIQQCFWRGFVCVRGFDRTTRRPKPLYARLHFPASKATKDKRAAAEAANKE